MPTNQDMHAFVVKWIDKFRNAETTGYELADDISFSEDCFSFGFKTDCGESFISAYHNKNAFEDCQELERLISELEASPYIFKGKPKKMKIISNCLCYGPCPMSDDEAEQRLTITSDGRIYFSSYEYGNGIKYNKAKTRNFKISGDITSYILKLISDYFSDDYVVTCATDIGYWEMVLENDANIKYKFGGSLCPMIDELENISSIIRTSLDMPELLLFDGNANSDRIEKTDKFQ